MENYKWLNYHHVYLLNLYDEQKNPLMVLKFQESLNHKQIYSHRSYQDDAVTFYLCGEESTKYLLIYQQL